MQGSTNSAHTGNADTTSRQMGGWIANGWIFHSFVEDRSGSSYQGESYHCSSYSGRWNYSLVEADYFSIEYLRFTCWWPISEVPYPIGVVCWWVRFCQPLFTVSTKRCTAIAKSMNNGEELRLPTAPSRTSSNGDSRSYFDCLLCCRTEVCISQKRW